MTSEKQIEANRKNAFKSTGPSTSEGKIIISQNALKHGILSNRVPIDEEERKRYLEFSMRLNEELSPADSIQELLVDRIISCAWRLQRLIHVESLLLKKSMYPSWTTTKVGYDEAFSGEGVQSMGVLSKYERSIENSLYRALLLLRELQNRPAITPPSS